MDAIEMLPRLLRAAYAEDIKAFDDAVLLLGRKLKKDYPKISDEIIAIAANRKVGANIYRSIDFNSLPIDKESRDNLLDVEEPMMVIDPILSISVRSQFDDFIQERHLINEFLEEGIVPSNSILLYGRPGVGKTYSARWLADKLRMPLVTVDLAATMSSYLGKSGQNIKSIFDFAKNKNVVLFLDEIDAIAKRRDDESDLGELKRLVNVLLKELDDLPINCVVIGATNHPELLDRAIWRRFDRVIELDMPAHEERKALFERELGQYVSELVVMNFLVENTDNVSASEICKLCTHIKRQIIMNKSNDVNIIAIKEICKFVNISGKEGKKQLCKKLKDLSVKITIKQISEITGVSVASVNRYLKGENLER